MICKRGRPKKGVSKCNQYRLRLTDGELEMLNYLSLKTEKPKSEVLIKALKMYYNISIYQD